MNQTQAEVMEKLKNLPSSDLLCKLEETQHELQLANEKYLTCSKELIEEARRSHHYLKLLTERSLLKQTEENSKQSSDVQQSTGKCMKQVDRKSTEMDGEVSRTFSNNSKVACQTSSVVGSGTTGILEPDDGTVVMDSPFEPSLNIPTDLDIPFVIGKTGEKPLHSSLLSSKQETVASRKCVIEDQQKAGTFVFDRKLLDDITVEVTDAVDVTATIATVQLPPSGGVSYDLATKVMQQNARLKKLLRKIVDAQGISVQEFLDKSDNADTIERLRQEVAILQTRVTEQCKLLKADDNELRRKCSALTDKVRELEHQAIVQQAFVDSYSIECERLQNEVKRLTSVVISTQSADAAGVSQTTGSGSGTTQGGQSKELAKSFIQLKSQYDEMIKLLEAKLTDVSQQLKAKVQTIAKLERENEELSKNFIQLKSQYEEMVKLHEAELTNVSQQLKAKMQTIAKLEGENERLDACCKESKHELLELKGPLCKLVKEATMQRANPLPCTVAERFRSPLAFHLPREGLVSDGQSPAEPPTETGCHVISPVILPAEPCSSGNINEKSSSTFSCERCEKEFDDEIKYKEHCKKCTDD